MEMWEVVVLSILGAACAGFGIGVLLAPEVYVQFPPREWTPPPSACEDE